MAIAARPDRRSWTSVTTSVVLVLIVANVMTNRVLPEWTYVPWNLGIAAVILFLARREVSLPEMGFTEWRRGAAWGAVLLILTIGALLLAVAMPAFHQMYHDRRVSGGTMTWLYQAFVRIPLGTAVLEETAFRAVLPALYAQRRGVLRGCMLASLWFGLWHVLPAMHLNSVNPTVAKLLGSGVAGQTVGIAFAVVGTALAGLWWCWVRYRSGSVLATMLAHVATNSVAYTIAFLVNR